MKTIDPDRARLPEILAAIPQRTPIVMLNLLRFRPEASYREGAPHPACTGREAYARYAEVALPKVKEAGGTVLWMGQARGSVIAPADEAWDDVFLVRYPSIEAFVGMITKPDYLAAAAHRTAALDDARLIATVEEKELAGSKA